MTTITVYKIKATTGPNAGKFSTGGNSPSFTDQGKSWNKLGFIKSHLNRYNLPRYSECKAVLVSATVTIQEEDVTPMVEIWKGKMQDAQVKKDEAILKVIATRTKADLAELHRLNELYPKGLPIDKSKTS